MKLSEARSLWHRYMFWWNEGALDGTEWARALLRKDMRITQLEAEKRGLEAQNFALRELEKALQTELDALKGGG